MGYGGIDKSEDNLTSFGNVVNMLGANEQQTAANEQANEYFQQAGYATQYAAEQAGMEQYSVNLAAGAQSEGFAAGGVNPGEGTPLAVANTTRALGQIQVNAIMQQGALESQLEEEQGQISQQGGLEDVISAEGQNVTNTQQTKISQAVQNTELLDNLLTGGLLGGMNVLSAALS